MSNNSPINPLPPDCVLAFSGMSPRWSINDIIMELIYNSIDAGSTQIDVFIKYDCIPYIRVSDNGCGILSNDFPNLCRFNHTSKLSSLKDLPKIPTFGDAGTSLAEISCLSTVRITSATRSSSGSSASFQFSTMLGTVSQAKCTEGTIVEVLDLYRNDPDNQEVKYMPAEMYKRILGSIQKVSLAYHYLTFIFFAGSLDSSFKIGPYTSTLSAFRGISMISTSRFVISAQLPPSPVFNAFLLVSSNTNGLSKPMRVIFVNGRKLPEKEIKQIVLKAFRPIFKNEEIITFALFVNLPIKEVDEAKEVLSGELRKSVHDCLKDVIESYAEGLGSDVSKFQANPQYLSIGSKRSRFDDEVEKSLRNSNLANEFSLKITDIDHPLGQKPCVKYGEDPPIQLKAKSLKPLNTKYQRPKIEPIPLEEPRAIEAAGPVSSGTHKGPLPSINNFLKRSAT